MNRTHLYRPRRPRSSAPPAATDPNEPDKPNRPLTPPTAAGPHPLARQPTSTAPLPQGAISSTHNTPICRTKTQTPTLNQQCGTEADHLAKGLEDVSDERRAARDSDLLPGVCRA